ncbi:zinc finger protein 70-like [Culicoides brevitarsis]|uniref:zinc finger protein 70-like n=1 Tax=Culicoides brevitarsis TaxID=469753 RepID=UPI00307C66C9
MDIERTCRACLKESDNLEPIFSTTGSNLIQKFEFLSIKLTENDCLPSSICEFCKSKLLVAYQFAHEVTCNEKELLEKLSESLETEKFHEEIEILEPEEEPDDVVYTIEVQKEEFSENPVKTEVEEEKSLPYQYIKSQKIISNGKLIYIKECPICHTMQQNLKQHMLVHSGVRKHKCSLCDKSFAQISNLNHHMKLHVDEGKKARPKCDLCGKSFSEMRSLKRHEVKHTGERKYECDLCPKKFLYSHNLLNHKRSHLNEKRYKCKNEGCEKAFVTCSELLQHTKKHEKDKNKVEN